MPFAKLPDGFCNDAVVEGVVYKLRRRSLIGQNKYKTTLGANNAGIMERLNHLQEELMDGANYIEWVMRKLDEATLEVHKRKGEDSTNGRGNASNDVRPR